MQPGKLILDALSRCEDPNTRSLEDFLGNLLDEEMDALAQLPGTPGQVMAAQFTHYARSSVHLTECLRRGQAENNRCIALVMRLPTPRGKRRAG